MEPLCDRLNGATDVVRNSPSVQGVEFRSSQRDHSSGLGSDLSLTLTALNQWLEGWMNRRFEVYQYRQILLHMRQGESDRAIAEAKLCGRRKAAVIRQVAEANGWLNSALPLPDDKDVADKLTAQRQSATTSQVTPFADLVKKWVGNGIKMTTILAALRRDYGFTGSYSAVRRFAQQFRKPKNKATMILDFEPGDAAQVDFGAGPMIPDPTTGKLQKTWFFLMTLAYSRHAFAEIVPNQKISTWQECHRHAFEFFGGVPRKIIIDNLKTAITRACLYDPEIQRSYETFAESYGFIISPCPPRDPEKKGRVEAGVKYVANSFMPLRELRTFPDSNRQLREWLLGDAGHRIHGTTGKAPLEVFSGIEKPLLQPLLAVTPETVEWARGQVYRNNHVRFDKNWYSVPFTLIDKDVWVRAGPKALQVFFQNKLVAAHTRVFGIGEHQTVNDHLSPECRSFADHSPEWCREQAAGVGVCCQEVIERLLSHPRLDCLRSAQRILRFRDTYSNELLEMACEQALACDSIRVTTVRGILARLQAGIGIPDTSQLSGDAYLGNGRFVRKQLNEKPNRGGEL